MKDVLIVGAGPVGLTLAAELARHGARSLRIIDRLARPSAYCRAIGVTPRTLEVWDDMGIAQPMIDAGLWIRGLRSLVVGHPLQDLVQDLSDLPYAQLGLPQYETERLLTAHLATFGIAVERATSLVAVEDPEGVRVRLEGPGGGEAAGFRYVVGCDGAHSTVRHAAGIAFEGEAYPFGFMLGDVRIAWDLPRGLALRALRLVPEAPPDMFVAIPLPERGRYRVSMLAPESGGSGTDHGLQAERPGPSLDELQAVADDLLPDRPRLEELRWSSHFRISMRLADSYRRGRLILAGDAAHIHPPTGGQGMNTGIQDAYNLAWKLALVVGGEAPDSLLDSYEAERRPVGAEVVARTRAASERYGREGGKPHRLADTQVLVSYRDSAGAALAPGSGPAELSAGDRAPDCQGLRRRGVGFPLRLFDLLRGPQFVLLVVRPEVDEGEVEALERATAPLLALARGRMRVRLVAGRATAADPLAVSLAIDEGGTVAAAYGDRSAYLVRPDGHIAWAGQDVAEVSLQACLLRFFGG